VLTIEKFLYLLRYAIKRFACWFNMKAKKKKPRVKTRHIAIPVEPADGGGGRAKFITLFALLSFIVLTSVMSLTGAFGPYADWLAKNEQTIFGTFPLGLLLASISCFSIWLLLKKVLASSKEDGIPFGHYALGFLLLYVFFSLILSVKDPLKEVPLSFKNASSEYAGYIGLFLTKNFIKPIFEEHTKGLLFCCGLGILMTSFCFGLRPKHLLDFAQRIKFGFQNLLYHLEFAKKQPQITTCIRRQVTGDYIAVRLGEVKPARGSPFGKQEKQSVYKDPFKSELETQIPINDETSTDVIDRINQELAYATDPREIRRLRDELAEYNRIKDINKWEDEKGGELRIEGLLGKKEQPVSSSEWLVASKEPTPLPALYIEPEQYDEYRVPLITEILGVVPEQTIDYTEDELKKVGESIESQLDNFKVKGKVTGIMTGPVITRFEIEPGPGVKVSRFESLADDLALTLKTSSVRVIPSIPGKSAVGIEIPNRRPQTVFCREILESSKFIKDPKKIYVVLGKDVMGEAFAIDLTRTPHLLIAGQTGAGKSVCINVLLASILFSKTPEEIRLLLVDPKVVELAMYKNIPHLLHPVITSPEVAVQALKWLCVEMDRRYEILACTQVRNIEGFNDKFRNSELSEAVAEEERKQMPFIVVIIDELADLMMTAGKEIETSIARIAQKARAVGIHLVLATQRPSVSVITGVIKANLPSRISFKVASYIDSRTILDGVGAEKLLGKGDMLFRSNDNPEPVRIHGAFLKDSEVENLANACSSQNVNYERIESFDLGETEANEDIPAFVKSKDSLFWEAARLGLETGELSISTLQRRLSIGFARAGKIMDQLTAEGICGKPNGSKPRKMLMDEEMLSNLEKR
jgi:DNA segregation ATPase FtsK/SpoIIIE-like protein